MIAVLRSILKNIPTFLLAIALASAVWISAVSYADPNQELPYSRPVQVEVIGQDPGLILTSNIPTQIYVTLKAPKSVWDRLIAEDSPVTAIMDLSNLASGNHDVSIQLHVAERPVEIISVIPAKVKVTLETLSTHTYPIHLTILGDPAVGFQAGNASLSKSTISISGPEALVKRVNEVKSIVNIAQVQEDLVQTVVVDALDGNGLSISGITLTPNKITVSIPITQRGGYRNVVIKVVTTGQIASGYRLTNISAYPPSVTIFSTNPLAIENLPGYVETVPIDTNGVKEDLDVQATLNLPVGVSVVGNQTVAVQVGVAAIEGSLTLSNMHVQMIGLGPGLEANLSPDRVDVILTGPLYLLDQLNSAQVTVSVDLTNQGPGVIKLTPLVSIVLNQIRAESVLPGTIEVSIIEITPTPSPTVTPTGRALPTIKPTPTPRLTPTPTP
jgi:YbbR domain-containing protein